MKLSKMRRAVTATAVAVVAALALSACGSSGPSGSGGDSGGATAWALTGQQQAFQTAFDSWNAANPTQTVTVSFFANDAYKSKIRTAVGSGQGPTLVYGWGGGVLKTYVDAKIRRFRWTPR